MPLPKVDPEELNYVECEVIEIPKDEHPRVFAAQFNRAHGLPLRSEDWKHISRGLYRDRQGATVKQLAEYVGISRRRFASYTSDLIEEFEEARDSLVQDLHLQGLSQEAISERLKKKYPYAKGVSQSSVSETLARLAEEGAFDESPSPGPGEDPEPTPDNTSTEPGEPAGDDHPDTGPEEPGGEAGDEPPDAPVTPDDPHSSEQDDAPTPSPENTKTVLPDLLFVNAGKYLMVRHLDTISEDLKDELIRMIEEAVQAIKEKAVAASAAAHTDDVSMDNVGTGEAV